MTLRLRFGKFGWLFAFAIFYIVTGGLQFFLLGLSGFRLFPVGVLGVLSLITAYGLIKKKRWLTLLITALLPLVTTFGGTILYSSILIETFSPNIQKLLFHLALITYLALNAIAVVYVLAKRETFQ
jgi:hypothetical protein